MLTAESTFSGSPCVYVRQSSRGTVSSASTDEEPPPLPTVPPPPLDLNEPISDDSFYSTTPPAAVVASSPQGGAHGKDGLLRRRMEFLGLKPEESDEYKVVREGEKSFFYCRSYDVLSPNCRWMPSLFRGSGRPGQEGQLIPLKFGGRVGNYILRLCRAGVEVMAMTSALYSTALTISTISGGWGENQVLSW